MLAFLGLDTSDVEEDDPFNPEPPDVLGEREEPLLCPELLDDRDEDDLCHETLERFERQRAFQTQLLQQSGGGLTSSVGTFDFELQPYVDRQSPRMGVRERHFQTRLRQRGNFITQDNLARALQNGLRRAVDQVLRTTPNLHDQDRLYFTLSSNRLTNNFHGWGLRAGEWGEGGARLEALFNRLAQALNSNEEFEMDDSFQLSITQVHHAPQGTGKPHRGKPGHATLQTLTRNSKSVIRIQNNDELCCARALVVAKARLDPHPKWQSIQRGKGPLQRRLAWDLHDEAHVPLGPCGYDALTAFSAAPSLVGYQIILVNADRSFHITTFSPHRDKQLILLHEKEHYDVITRLPGFFGSSYVCAYCWKPYDHEGQHRCTKRKGHCLACCQKACPDFLDDYPKVSKPRDVVGSAIATFSGTRVTKPIAPKTIRANQRPAHSYRLLSSTSMCKVFQAGRRNKEETQALASRRSLPQTRGSRGASNLASP